MENEPPGMAFGGLPYGVLIVDVHGKVLFISPAAVKLLGVDPCSVDGAHCWELATAHRCLSCG